jgi:chromosome segregation ATPase
MGEPPDAKKPSELDAAYAEAQLLARQLSDALQQHGSSPDPGTTLRQLQDLLSHARQTAADAQADARRLREANDVLRQEVDLLRAQHDALDRARNETDNELLAVSRRNEEIEFELAELAQRTQALSSVEQEFSDVRAERDTLLEMVAQLQSEFAESHRKSVAGDAPDLETFEKEMNVARTLIASLEEQCRRTEHRIVAYRAEFQRERDTSERLRAALMRTRGISDPGRADASSTPIASVRVNTVRLHVVERTAGETDDPEPEPKPEP